MEHSTLGGVTNASYQYDSTGNITSRSDVAGGATWTYDSAKKHAVRQAGSANFSYTYDANGNAITRNGIVLSWTSYNHPSNITGRNLYDGTTESVDFAYDQNHERYKAAFNGSAGLETAYVVGGLFEKVITAGATDFRHYIFAAGTKIAIYSRTVAGVNTLRYVREDYQGGVSALLNSDGTMYVKESFAAFGIKRNPCTWTGAPTSGNLGKASSATRFGYTWQQALGELGLNDMHGRIQDATTGRFLSADPYITSPANTQSFNRYSYVLNNPLRFTDPTGFDAYNDASVPLVEFSMRSVDAYIDNLINSLVLQTVEVNGTHIVDQGSTAGLQVSSGGPAYTGGGGASVTPAPGVPAPAKAPPDIIPEVLQEVVVCASCKPHHYAIHAPLCFCSQAEAFDAFRDFSAPGAPRAQDGTHEVMLLGVTSGNPIEQTVDPTARTIKNVTRPGHFFGGQVSISFSTASNVTSVDIEGSGNGPHAELNQLLGPAVFTELAMQAFFYLNPGMSGGSL